MQLTKQIDDLSNELLYLKQQKETADAMIKDRFNQIREGDPSKSAKWNEDMRRLQDEIKKGKDQASNIIDQNFRLKEQLDKQTKESKAN